MTTTAAELALAPDTYLGHIRRESARFREVLTACPGEARVPSCPDWSATDLCWHLAEVQQFWSWVVTHRPDGPEAYVEPDRPESAADIAAFFDASHARLVAALEAADPADPCWSWSTPAEHHRVGWVLRRQAHEALIHRRDAELAAGALTPMDPALAADGVDEVLAVMYGGAPPHGRFEPSAELVRFDLTDLPGAAVWVRLGTFSGAGHDGRELTDEPDLRVVQPTEAEPTVVLAGTAEAVDTWLWHRADDSALRIDGNDDALTHLRAVLGQAID